MSLPSTALDGVILVPGVYTASAYLKLDGTLTFNADGDPDGVFVITVASYLEVNSGAAMVGQDEGAPHTGHRSTVLSINSRRSVEKHAPQTVH